MNDFWTLTTKDKVMDFLDEELDMTAYSVVKQDEAAITDVINKVWGDDIESYIENCWRDICTNIADELVEQGYLKEDD
jgi:hypothetical protein